MRSKALVVLSALLLLFAGTRLHADEQDTERDLIKRDRLMQETVTIQHLEARAMAQKRLTASLFALFQAHAEAQGMARRKTTAEAGVLKLRITQREEALGTERKRSGVGDSEPGKQLIEEQQRHTRDVQHLQTELMRANECSACNLLEVTQAMQRHDLAYEKLRGLRDHLVQALWILGEIGPAAEVVRPWLEKTEELGDEILAEGAQAAALRITGDDRAARDPAERRRRMRESIAIRLYERRTQAHEQMSQWRFEVLEAQNRSWRAARQRSAAGLGALKLRVMQLDEALEIERKREGVNEDEVIEQVAAEQKRHVMAVQQLMTELAQANEAAEANRIEATSRVQRVAVVEEEHALLRAHLLQSIRLLGEIGPPAKVAVPWLKETKHLGVELLTKTAEASVARIEGTGD